jgi:hypothetical protein
MRHLQYFDYSTWSMVETDALGFFTVDVPAEPETSFLMPGDVYIALDADEISQMGYYNDYAKLTFTDKALPTADNIAALKGMGDGDATLKLDTPALVTFANDKFLAIEDNTGGLFVENPGLTVQPGDQLSGELSGSYNGSVLYPLMQKSAQTDVASITVTPGEAAPLGKAVASLEEAFDNQMVLVRLTGVKAVVVHGSYSDEYKFELDGTEVDVFPGLDASDEQLAALSDGDELEEVTGYAFVIPETSMYASFYALYQFLPVSIKVKEQAPQEFDYDQISISPAQGQVTSLENFDITFGGQAVTINEDANITLANAATGDVVADGGMELDEDGTLHVGLADRISAYGRYTLNIPTGAIFFNGTSLDPLSFNYTIKDPSAPAYTIDPAPGTVESLSTFTITFNDYLVDVNDEEALAIIFNTETEAEVQSDFIGAIAGGQKVYISFPEVTTPGEYELIVFDSSIQRTADGKFLPELSFSYTVEAPVVKLPAYKVYEVADGQTVRTTEGEAEMGASVKVPYRHYNVVDGKLYQKGTTGKEYNYTFTLNADGQEETLTYTATGTQDIVFLAEAEDIEGLTPCTSANSAVRSSNSAAAYAAEADVEVVRLPAGTYKLTAAIFDSSKNPNSMWYFLAGNDTIARLNCTAVNYQERTSEKFTLESETTISLAKGGNGNMGIDLIYIQAVEAETPIFAYTVNEVAAGQTVRTTSGTAEKASVVKVPFRQYNVVEGILYKKAQVGKEFNYTFTLNADQQTENLEYDATDVENVVFLAEGEDIEGLTPITTGNSAIRSSNSAAAYAAEADVEFVTLPAGTYKLVAVLYDSSKEPDSHFIFKAGETVVADLNCTVVNIQEVSSDEFTLNTQSALTIAQCGSVSCGIDLIYIVKTADAVDGIATVSASTAQAPVYDLQGRKVARTAKAGIYIQRSAEGRLQGKNVKKMVVR